LAQYVLALLLVRLGLDVVPDLRTELKIGEALSLELQRELQALDDVGRLEQPHPVPEREIRRIRAGIGERSGLDDGAQEACDPLVGAAHLEDLLDDGPVLAG